MINKFKMGMPFEGTENGTGKFSPGFCPNKVRGKG